MVMTGGRCYRCPGFTAPGQHHYRWPAYPHLPASHTLPPLYTIPTCPPLRSTHYHHHSAAVPAHAATTTHRYPARALYRAPSTCRCPTYPRYLPTAAAATPPFLPDAPLPAIPPYPSFCYAAHTYAYRTTHGTTCAAFVICTLKQMFASAVIT